MDTVLLWVDSRMSPVSESTLSPERGQPEGYLRASEGWDCSSAALSLFGCQRAHVERGRQDSSSRRGNSNRASGFPRVSTMIRSSTLQDHAGIEAKIEVPADWVDPEPES